MSLAAKEYTPEELDALEAQAKQRPVYDQIAGGVGAAMAYYDGPQETKAEYTPEELDVRDALYAQPELTPEELDQRLVNAKYDANTLLPPEQLKEADAVENRLRDQGKQPGIADTAFAVGGGILQSVADWNMALDKGGNVKAAVKNVLIKTGVINGDYERMPMLEAALQAPASAKAGVQGAALNAMETAIALNGLAKGKPRYRVKETGEFVFAPLGGVAPLTQLAGEGKTLVPVTDADLEEHRYQQYATENAIRKTYLDVTSEEVLGQAPNQSFTLPVEIVADPWNLIAFGAANKVTGAARMGKLFSSKTLGAAEAVAGGSANIIDKGADVFTKAVQKMSFGLLKRDTQRAIAKSAAYGGGAAAVGTMLTKAPPEARNTALALMSLYPMYKMGSGVLRRVEGVAGTGKLIMREAADATNGLDDVARAAVASNPKVPQQIREVLTNPSKFTPIESTPARIAKSEAFSPQVREVAARLANPLVVQASRAAGATARGAALGTALNIPFAEAYREMGDERTADSVYAGGLLFGAAGGAASRVTGAKARRRDAAVSDIGRMLVDIQKTNAGEDIGAPGVNRAFETYYSMAEPGRMLTDVELAGGDIDSLLRNTKFEDLAGMAAMQGFYRDTVDFVPLNAFDYEANVKALGGTGTAGYFLHAPEGQRARLFLNADARRTDVAPHEYGHALLQSAATSPEMKNSARAFINQRYGPERLDAMAREYAGQLIKNRNAKSFPDQKMDVSEAEIDSMIYELGESGLGRGDGDRLDWLRDEIFAEEHRAAGIDYAQIRRNIPNGFSVVGFAENVLGANARALGVAGVPIDPQTGALQTPPDRLFKDDPLLAADSVMRRNVQQYVRAYKQWLNDPAHEVPTGAAVSRTGNPNELKNNPNVTFRDYGNGRLENELAFIDESGNVKVKDKKNDPERAKFIRARQQQVREMIDRGTKEPNDPTFGSRVRDGQRIVAGKKLPPRFDMTRFPAPLKDLARRTEALAEAGETMQVRYFALGKSKDVFKQGDIRGVQAINREVMFVEWQATKDGNINAFVVDLTQFRNRAMKAIADRDPSLSEINWDFKQLEADLRRVLDNHANGRAGADGIGDKRRNAVNALLGIGTKTNRIANELAGLGGKGSALKTLRLDAFDEVAGTGRQGFEFDYQKANGNFMPDQPAPRPNMDSDLKLPNRMPSALPQSGMAMPDVGSPENQPKAAPTDQQTMIQRNPAGDYEPLGMLRKQPNGKWAVYTAPMMATNKDGTQTMLPPSKLAEYPNEAKARARAEKEFFTSLPLQDAKQYLGARERQAITEAQQRIAEVAKNNPEAARLEVTRDDRGLPKVGLIEDADGNPVLDARGNQKFGAIYRKAQYDLRKAPGLSKDEARAVQQAADLMEADARRGRANPAIAKGIGWYGRMRGWLQQAYGATIELFGQLLGATSARTPVDTNFIQAREALQIFGRGGYDDLLGRFDAFVMQKKADADSGKMEADWRKKGGKGTFKLQDEYRKQVNKFDEVPLRGNGKKYNANSTKVLHALYGNWIAQTKGPKTPNFAGNLTGRTFKATIDVWAARNLRRLLYEGKSKRWRILPEQEQGVADVDFFFVQKVYDEVGKRMGIATDDLQALQWFNEKDIWETNDWTDKTGAEKSSFDKEAGKLNLDRYQVGLTTFQDAGNFDPAVQRAELTAFRDSIRAQEGLEAARVTESEGLYGNVVEPTFDAEFSVNRKGEVSPSIEPIVRQAIDTANRNKQNDVFISAVVEEAHPNARPMVEVGFKSAASRAEIDAVTAVFRGAGIDGFTVARNERGDVLGIRAQYVPEISARYDTPDHLDPVKFGQNAATWAANARKAIANISGQDNVSYRKEGYVSTNVYGIEEYGSVKPADILRSNARTELGRRRAILAAGTR